MRAHSCCFVLVIAALASTAHGEDAFAKTSGKVDYATLDYPVGEVETYEHDSGPWDNDTGLTAMRHRHVIQFDGAAWIRVFFSENRLEKGSFIRITSRLDGEIQELDAGALAMWGNASAFFNGDEVTVELVAGPDTAGNRFMIGEVARLFHSPQPVGGSGECGICGSDDRVPSGEDWAARLFPAGCTASVYNEDSCMVSAGHCVGESMVVQFNVPNSQSNCNTINPPVADQFPIVNQSSVNGGVGNDWSVLIPGTNNLGQLPFERYGEFRPIAAGPAGPGQLTELTGYGVDFTCTRS